MSPGGALTERGASFRAFQQAGGAALRRFAVFETLHETHLAAVADHSWRRWDRAFQDPGSLEVAQFAAAHCEQVEYAEYLQWEADRQLGEAARRGRDSGLSVGMYRDLAIGVDPHGADAWSDPELLVSGATVGAPPDQLNLNGQNWGLAPVNPLVLHRRGYAPFIAGLRANMRHAGILRIDHVMGLQHLYWVPHGAKPTEGAYIRYPFDDLMGVLALESHRQRCAIIGEDLGTVPDGFRERMQEANVLCCRVLLFERRDDGSFIPPDQYPASAAASVGTHDVATFKGYWTGHDLDWRRTLNLYPTPEQREADEESRIGARRSLLDALAREGLLPPDLPEMRDGEFSPALSEAVHRFLGRSAARLVMVQIEDLLGEIEQVNLPGTLDEHPNWRRKLSRTIEDLLRDENFLRLAKALNKARAGER